MTESNQCTSSDQWSIETISAGGERITHLHPNDCYYAHLSIYHFAVPFIQNKFVLDAGSGAGYGSAYLADHGARFVQAMEISSEAVAFSKYHFQKPNLQFQVMDLQNISGLEDHSVDFVFSSNVLEHVPDVLPFFHTVYRALKPEGLMLIGVPPILNEDLQADNMANPYHLNIWTPRQWHHVLNLFFADVQYYQHIFEKPGIVLNFGNSPAQTIVREQDFTFNSIPLEEALCTPTLTSIFLVRNPRPQAEIPLPDSSLTFVDDSFTIPSDDYVAQVMSAQLARQRQTVQMLTAQVAEQQRLIESLKQQIPTGKGQWIGGALRRLFGD